MEKQHQIFKFLFLGLILSFSSCKKDLPNRPEFVAGEVLIQTFDTVSFYNTYKLVDSLHLKIKEENDVEYFIKTTADRVDTINSILHSKSYLTNAGRTFGTIYFNDTLHITAIFFDIDSVKANDWFNTISMLNLKEKLNGNLFKWGIIMVPIGQEKYWVDEFLKHSIIKSADLNGIIYIN